MSLVALAARFRPQFSVCLLDRGMVILNDGKLRPVVATLMEQFIEEAVYFHLSSL